VAINGPNLQPLQREIELDVSDFTQEIDAQLDDFLRRDEPTLSQVDFDELEITLGF
jgi:hypothetical protein